MTSRRPSPRCSAGTCCARSSSSDRYAAQLRAQARRGEPLHATRCASASTAPSRPVISCTWAAAWCSSIDAPLTTSRRRLPPRSQPRRPRVVHDVQDRLSGRRRPGRNRIRRARRQGRDHQVGVSAGRSRRRVRRRAVCSSQPFAQWSQRGGARRIPDQNAARSPRRARATRPAPLAPCHRHRARSPSPASGPTVGERAQYARRRRCSPRATHRRPAAASVFAAPTAAASGSDIGGDVERGVLERHRAREARPVSTLGEDGRQFVDAAVDRLVGPVQSRARRRPRDAALATANARPAGRGRRRGAAC